MPVCPTCHGDGFVDLVLSDESGIEVVGRQECIDCSARGWVLDEAALEKSWVEFWRTLAASVEAYEALREELKPLTPLEQQQRFLAYLEHKGE